MARSATLQITHGVTRKSRTEPSTMRSRMLPTMPPITNPGISGEIPRRSAQRATNVTKMANVAREPIASAGAGPSTMPSAYDGLRAAPTLESTCQAASFDHWSTATITNVNSTYGWAPVHLTLDPSDIGLPNLSSLAAEPPLDGKVSEGFAALANRRVGGSFTQWNCTRLCSRR